MHEPSVHFLSLSQQAFLHSSEVQAAADFLAQHPLFIIEQEETDKIAVRVRSDKNFIDILILENV